MARGLVAALAAPGLLWLASAAPAPAADLEFYTGQALNADCAATSDAPDYAARQATCAGYVLGVSDAQQAAQGAGGRPRVCLPPSANSTQLATTVAAYLVAHAEKRPLAAQDVVLDALASQYPCK